LDLLHGLTLSDVVRGHARAYPQKTALVCGHHRLTYAQFDERVDRLSAALRAEGFDRGDRVLWIGQNCHRLLEGLVAAARLGGIFCPVNWRQSAGELAFVIADVDARVVLWQEEEIGVVVANARAIAGGPARWIQHDGPSGYEELIADAPASPGAPASAGLPADIDPGDPVLMMYTAAFGGRPNGALLSHRAIVNQSVLMAKLQEVDGEYVYLNSGPLFHIATFMTTLATLQMGGTNVFTRRVDAEEICRLIESERCTGAFVIGPTIDQILAVNAERRHDLTSLRTFPGKPAWNDMVTIDTSPWARRPAGYGQTEVMGMATFNCLGPAGVGTSGRPSPLVQLRIVDPEGDEVADGETGEIVLRGLTVGNGYHNRPELNRQRLAGGWWHTNDLGRREVDGTVSFVGPKTRIVKSAAENIYPAEVEACIARHPAVKECAVIGVPDKVWTQSVKAIVVLRDGEAVTAADIIEHCRVSIASYKKPRTVDFLDALPRQGWAVDYDELDARFGGGGYPGVAGTHAKS
jgi:acyl-CoA synthetase (AMP-forming)/AMP-acid ligase II